jgi:hypothetical protein
MLELAIRLVAAAVVFIVSAWLGTPSLSLGSIIAISIAAYAGIGYWLETQGKRNSGVSGILSVCDSGAILFTGATVNGLDAAAFLGILPVLYAFRRYQVNLWLTAPCVVGLLFSAASITQGSDVNPTIYVEAVAALAFPLLLKLPTTAPAASSEMPSWPQAIPANTDTETREFLVLREKFRKVKERCEDLEQIARRDRTLARLHDCRMSSGQLIYTKLAEAICEVSGAESVAVYTLSQFGDAMIARGASGPLAKRLDGTSYAVDLAKATRRITDDIELTTRAMFEDEDRAKVGCLLLTQGNRITGMVNLFHSDWDNLFGAKRQMEPATKIVAAIMSEAQHNSGLDRRLKELELLYETAVISAGSIDRAELIDRVSRRLSGVVDADFVGAYEIGASGPTLIGSAGDELDFLDSMSFASGPAFNGWLAAGAPELAVFHLGQDQRCITAELTQKRIGSFILVPLQFAEEPFGYLVAVSRASNGLGPADLSALRAIASECSQAVCRIEQPEAHTRGLVTSAAFQSIVSSATTGCIVYFELLKRQQFLENCGAKAVDTSLREFSYRLRGKLTPGSAATQRGAGGFIVYLPNDSTSFVSNWANDVAATASMIGVKTSGGKTSIPLAFRARVASLAPQSHEDFAEQAS